jgi:hypothetical protein
MYRSPTPVDYSKRSRITQDWSIDCRSTELLDQDNYRRLDAREYNLLSMVRALLCRELLGLSGEWFYR